MLGSWISIRMRSGRCFATAASACSPSSASVISQSVPASISRIIWRLSSSSSITSMRLLMLAPPGLNVNRERESKRGALAGLRLDPDSAPVHLDDALRYGESQAGAALLARDGIVRLLELLKQLDLIDSGDAGASVPDRYIECAIIRFGLNGDFACVGELDRIAYEIDQDLSQAPPIAMPWRQFGRNVDLERELLV